MAHYYILIVIISASMCYGKTLTDTLLYYNTLNKEQFRHRIIRRSLPRQHDRDIDFVSHDKIFRMKLVQSKDILASSFHVSSVDRYGKQSNVHIDLDFFYEGYIEDDPSSRVVVHLEDDGMITATIDTEDDTYVVEPMRNHVDNDVTRDMIVYKWSDVKWNLTNPGFSERGNVRFCGYNDTAAERTQKDSRGRFRRSDNKCEKYRNQKNTCKLHLVSDYSFFVNVGRGNIKTTFYNMLHKIKVANDIYKDTCWSNNIGKGIGLQVTKVTVHSDSYSNIRSYNEKKKWNVHYLLTEFTRIEGRSKFCLVHLFTYQDFDDGSLGLAYIANPNANAWFRGICASENSGLTTHVHKGQRLTTLQAQIVTVHELGHNFGAKHDDGEDCVPGDDKGNYIMNKHSVTGEKVFNRQFSECSITRIGKVLQRRMSCLETRDKSMCGNSIVEDKEQCDEGTNKNDPCCKNCKLTSPAYCSDTNDLCCKNCSIIQAEGKICRESNTQNCENETRCDGLNKTCPKEIQKLKTGKECTLPDWRKGTCSNITGLCVSICGGENVTKPCACTKDIDVCKVCCMRIGRNETCQRHIPNKNEGDGVHCKTAEGDDGLCRNGMCNQIKIDISVSFRLLISNFSLNMALQYAKSHIVITILVLSLLIWVPASCIVNRIDNAQEKKYTHRIFYYTD